MNNQVSNEQYNNDWFKREIGASRFKQFIWYFTNVLFFINPLNPGSGIKKALLRLFGAKIGKGVVLKPSINIKYPWKLSIGDFSWIGEKVWIDNLGQVDIGKNVCISQGAMLLTGNHDYKKQGFDLMVGKIILKMAYGLELNHWFVQAWFVQLMLYWRPSQWPRKICQPIKFIRVIRLISLKSE